MHKKIATNVQAKLNIILHTKLILIINLKNYETLERLDLMNSHARGETLNTRLQCFIVKAMTLNHVIFAIQRYMKLPIITTYFT